MDTTSQTTKTTGNRATIVWGLAPVIWFLVLLGWTYGLWHFDNPVVNALGIAILALPAPWLLWASWRMPRPALKTYLAEGGALAAGLVALYLAVLTFMIGRTGPAPIALMVIFFAAAAVFVAAAWPLPGRRIAYGAAAIACVLQGIQFRVLYSDTSYYPGIDFMTKDELFAATFLGLPALGVLLQILWWLRRRNRDA